MNQKLFYFFLVSLSVLTSCEQPVKPIKLSSDDFKVVDSLVQVRKKAIKQELDSLCSSYNGKYYTDAVDSISKIRAAYIKEILE